MSPFSLVCIIANYYYYYFLLVYVPTMTLRNRGQGFWEVQNSYPTIFYSAWPTRCDILSYMFCFCCDVGTYYEQILTLEQIKKKVTTHVWSLELVIFFLFTFLRYYNDQIHVSKSFISERLIYRLERRAFLIL